MGKRHYLIEGILWIEKVGHDSYKWGVNKQAFYNKISDFDQIIEDLKKVIEYMKGLK